MKQHRSIQNPILLFCMTGLCFIGVFSFYLFAQTIALHTPVDAPDRDTILTSRGFESGAEALPRVVRAFHLHRSKSFSPAAEPPGFLPNYCFIHHKLLSTLHKSQATPLRLNLNCERIVCVTPVRAGPYSFFA